MQHLWASDASGGGQLRGVRVMAPTTETHCDFCRCVKCNRLRDLHRAAERALYRAHRATHGGGA